MRFRIRTLLVITAAVAVCCSAVTSEHVRHAGDNWVVEYRRAGVLVLPTRVFFNETNWL